MEIINDVPAGINWRIYKGDTAKITMFVNDQDDKAVDLTDYTVTGQIRQNPDDETSLQDLIITTDGNILYMQVADTSTLPKTCFFDIQTVRDTVVKTILSGRISIDMDVTR